MDYNKIRENFKNNIKIQDNILKIQHKLKLNQIKIEDLTIEEKDNLIRKYKEQIKEKVNRLNYLKQQFKKAL